MQGCLADFSFLVDVNCLFFFKLFVFFQNSMLLWPLSCKTETANQSGTTRKWRERRKKNRYHFSNNRWHSTSHCFCHCRGKNTHFAIWFFSVVVVVLICLLNRMFLSFFVCIVIWFIFFSFMLNLFWLRQLYKKIKEKEEKRQKKKNIQNSCKTNRFRIIYSNPLHYV